MNLQRLLNTKLGRVFISILLGIGLATLFQRTCSDNKCIMFNGPIIKDFDDKIYKYDGKCYKYAASASKCDTGLKKVLDITNNINVDGVTPASNGMSF